MEEEVSGLKGKIKNLDSVVMAREKEAKMADAIAEATKKQSEDLLEYDCLQEDNQNVLIAGRTNETASYMLLCAVMLGIQFSVIL
ncbi:hypothetical protein MRB53_010966 [Persea americana]|uniref:Uncharacterized protein n=1 Tax=Persea americana TaxID=3435 RepID=A0ACC2LTD3_PERAE|nr:hypothetical protein MRB53_010966 [Persea americana]